MQNGLFRRGVGHRVNSISWVSWAMPPFSIYSADNSWEVVLRSYRTRLTLSLATAFVLYLALTVSDARAVDVVVSPVKPTIDGVLGEWGAVAAIDISPAGDGVGLRGAFEDENDHWAAVHLSWDADSLYLAVSVLDDVLDRQPIGPGENVWEGPGGQRKDKMFYYDHLKVFLRGPEQPLGFNVWVAPNAEDGAVHAWGGQQRGTPTQALPLAMASLSEGRAYSYEIALPWTWLRLYPKPDMVLDALFLFPDSDLHGLELRKKIAESNKWIWWQGKLTLRGNPPGLREEPVSDVVEAIAQQKSEIVVPNVIPKAVQKNASTATESVAEDRALGENESVHGDSTFVEEKYAETDTASAKPPVVSSESTAPPIAELRARLNRGLLARSAVRSAPAWVRSVAGEGLRRGQVDSLYARLGETLARIFRANISSRTDGLVMDMAEYAGVWRAQAQRFLQGILKAAMTDVESGGERMGEAITQAAVEVALDEEQVRTFVRHLCKEALALYDKNKIAATNDLVDKARRKAGIERDEIQPLLEALVNQWQE
ncbi:MAG: hypothetical protein VX792_04175 [Candidatus Latescibacterota bacterium]|nr:hypothetical protein [Candidatus Latescibacterota bacterium]